MTNFLQVKLRSLNRCPAHWQDLVNQPDRFEVTINLVLHEMWQAIPAPSFY